jgi:hypothetical protein
MNSSFNERLNEALELTDWYHGTSLARAKQFLIHGFQQTKKLHSIRKQDMASWSKDREHSVAYAISTAKKDHDLPVLIIATLNQIKQDEDNIRLDIELALTGKLNDTLLLKHPDYQKWKKLSNFGLPTWKEIIRAILNNHFKGYKPITNKFAKSNDFQVKDLLIMPPPLDIPEKRARELAQQYGFDVNIRTSHGQWQDIVSTSTVGGDYKSGPALDMSKKFLQHVISQS